MIPAHYLYCMRSNLLRGELLETADGKVRQEREDGCEEVRWPG